MTQPTPKCDICGNTEKYGGHTLDAKDLMVFGAPAKIMVLTEMYYQASDDVATHILWACVRCRLKVLVAALESLQG